MSKTVIKRAIGINPPIRGSIANGLWGRAFAIGSQSPYKGFNSFDEKNMLHYGVKVINPPIRGSIEQDNALFKDYNHKR